VSSSPTRAGEAGPATAGGTEANDVRPAGRTPGGGLPLVDVTMPQMGVSVAEGTVVAWRAGVGDRVEADATVCEISTDKIDTEVPSPVSGVVAEILVAVESTVEVGAVLARIAPADTAAVASPVVEPAPSRSEVPVAAVGNGATATHAGATGRATGAARANGAPRRYSPGVPRLAADHGIALPACREPRTGPGDTASLCPAAGLLPAVCRGGFQRLGSGRSEPCRIPVGSLPARLGRKGIL